jgi:hypothetical protein
VFDQADAAARAAAAAAAAPGSVYRWVVYSRANVEVVARAQVNVEKVIDDLKKNQQDSGCTPNSFLAGTPVLMADKSTRPIAQVRQGDLVLATDPRTGQTSAEPVTDRIVGHGSKHLTAVTVAGDGRSGTLTATSNHPFWDADSRTWVEAGDLRVAEHLRPAYGVAVRVTGTRASTRTTTVYNLTVANVHTFYVETAGVPVLVHNAKRCTLKVDGVHEDWRTKGLHVHMPSGKEVTYYGVPVRNDAGRIIRYDARVRSSYSPRDKRASSIDLRDAARALNDPRFRANILDQGTKGLTYLRDNFPDSGEIPGLVALLAAVRAMS